MKAIVTEIEDAKLKLEVAHNKLNYATNGDEIDIAIFELKAAEIAINKLIKMAKLESR